MKSLVFTLLLFTISSNSFCQTLPDEVENHIKCVEEGLLEFKSPGGMLMPDSLQLANPQNIYERMKTYMVPGLGMSVINNNEVEWSKAYGVMDATLGEEVVNESIFQAASTSKLLTSVLLLHFVQNGYFDLDENINEYLKSWRIPENEFTDNEKVTLRRVLTHLAGLPSTNFNYDDSLGYPSLLQVLKGEIPALNKPAIPDTIPGSVWQYSNVGYDLIQLLLEDRFSRSFNEIAHEVIFDPLEMNSSSFSYPINTELLSLEVKPHDAEGITKEPAMHLSAFAHGGLTTTTSDLAKFTCEVMMAFQGKSDKILNQEMAKELFSPQHTIGPEVFGIPIIEGLGVLMFGEGDSFSFAHPGYNMPGMSSWLIGWPHKGTAIVVMTNGARGELLSMEIISGFVQEYLR